MKCTCNSYTLENYGCSCGADNPTTALDYLIDTNKKSYNYDSLRLRLCEILKLDYTQATDEDVIQEVKRLKNVEVFVDAHHRDWHSHD